MGDTIDTGESTPLTMVAGRYTSPRLRGLSGEPLVAALADEPFSEVTLTSDGRAPRTPLTWHTGDVPDPDQWVYYERWADPGRVAHGYVHPDTRQLIQSG